MENNNQNQKDPQLWELAQKRASFKYHLATYLVMNAFFWILWYLKGQKMDDDDKWPWPVWPLLGWGIGLAFHFIGTYIVPKENLAEKEYDKLKKKSNL
jgi:hypothetical protein